MRNELKIAYLKLNVLNIKNVRGFLEKIKIFIFGLILGHKFLCKLLIEK
jgi:hypothetical protein